MYLLYPRPRPRGLYSVRFEVYHTTSFLAAWQYKISPFDFLPAYRLAKILRFPVTALPVLCSVNSCQNNGSCYLMNSNQILCFCSREWHGRFCEKPLRNVTCARHSLVRDQHICICPYGYMQPRCFVRNTICEHSSPCPRTNECYAISQEPPNRYYCFLWLMCFVTVERAIAVVFPVRFRTFGKPRPAILLSVLTSTCVFASMYSHLVQYKFINHPNHQQPWCIRENESYEKSLMQYISLFHQISPFCTNILAALTIIIGTSRIKAHAHHQSTVDTLQEQARQRKDLLVGPLMCFLAQLPQIIILFLDICLYEEHHWFSHFTLLAYYISFLPQMNLFFLYILPSPLFKKLLVTETVISKRIIPMIFRHIETK
ncbi:unnamed protein product [Adineta steineri]|uniref:EGF-like domain-containing protein n=2 Tax=Adineta steineri TaxID=433720 RepID=A0A815TIQ1_9BILA|nr:unnamed protein product [Adineta steineri]